MSRTARILLAAMAAVAVMSTTSCVPDLVPVAPAPRAVLSPSAGPGGTYINVTAPDDACRRLPGGGTYPYASLSASLTVRSTGVVISTGSGFSYDGSVPSARLLVPPATRVGVYNVFLSCFSYLDSHMYEPAQFTVTAPF